MIKSHNRGVSEFKNQDNEKHQDNSSSGEETQEKTLLKQVLKLLI
jgi:hypothetical protein